VRHSFICMPRCIALTLSGATLSLVPPAQAADGKIWFEGKVTLQTCKINGLSKNADLKVPLPTVSTSASTGVGERADNTPFELKLTECAAAATTAYPHFELGSSVDQTMGCLVNLGTGPGSATNVQVALLNGDQSPVDLAAEPSEQNVQIGTLKPVTTGSRETSKTTGQATLKFYAEYVATDGAATGGTVNTSVLYTMLYE
jgi:major type 1 subunit fimbrin (pilin)